MSFGNFLKQIKKNEILNTSGSKGLRKGIVDLDYALSSERETVLVSF